VRMCLGNLYRLWNAKSFSISPENLTGEKGKGGMAERGTGSAAARDLGIGWKVGPSVIIEAGRTFRMWKLRVPETSSTSGRPPRGTGGSPSCGYIGATKSTRRWRLQWATSLGWLGTICAHHISAHLREPGQRI
jgi:hypothetical protein